MARAYSALSCETRSASILVLHVPPVGLPEAAHRGLGGPRLLRLGALAAHVDHGQLVPAAATPPCTKPPTQPSPTQTEPAGPTRVHRFLRRAALAGGSA